MYDGCEDYFLATIDLVWADPETLAMVYVGAAEAVTPEFLQQHGIQRVVSVSPEPYAVVSACGEVGVRHHPLPFLDASASEQQPEHAVNAAEAVQVVADAILNGERIVVHCFAGINRSPAVVYAALVALGRVVNTWEAHVRIVRNRSVAQHRKSLVRWVRHRHLETHT